MILKELANIEDKAAKLKFIKANKAAILKAKKSMFKTSCTIEVAPKLVKDETASKMDGTNETGVFEIVGNSIGFLDSHNDVSIAGSFNKTVNESGQKAPILINHKRTPDAIFAKNMGVSIAQKSIRSLGYDADGTTEALTAKIAPIYDAKMNELYSNGEIKQHSIGLQYVKLDLAINDESDNEGFANWQKYIDQVINREKAEQQGYFFAVIEQKLIEISAVLFGSNPYTPTLDENKEIEPSNDTHKTEPHESHSTNTADKATKINYLLY